MVLSTASPVKCMNVSTSNNTFYKRQVAQLGSLKKQKSGVDWEEEWDQAILTQSAALYHRKCYFQHHKSEELHIVPWVVKRVAEEGVDGWAWSGGPEEIGSVEEDERLEDVAGEGWGGEGGEWGQRKYQLGQPDQFCPCLDQVFR